MSEAGLANKVPFRHPEASQLKGRRLEAHFALALVISEALTADIIGC